MSATVFYADPNGNELATLQNVFSVGGVPTDPTTVTVIVTDPTGAQTTYSSPTHVSAGKYTQDVPTTVVGVWSYEWTGTGAAADVVAGTWTAQPLTSNQLYCTVEELKSRLGITDATDDFELTLAADGACRAIDEIYARYFWRGADTRTYEPESLYEQQFDDIVSVTSLKVDFDGDGVYEQTWAQGTDYKLTTSPGQHNPAAKGEQWPYTGIQVIGTSHFIPFTWAFSPRDRIQITGVFGWPAVPRNVKTASLLAAAQIFRIKDAPFGIAGFGEMGVVRVQAMPQVMWLIRRYITGQRVGV